MKFVKYSLVTSVLILALGIYFQQTYLWVCFGSLAIVLGLLYWILGYPRRLERKLRAKIAAGERLTPEEGSLLLQLMAIEKQSYSDHRSSYLPDQASRNRNFVKLAQKYENRQNRKSRYVPFKVYWPSYDLMNAAQQKWYFYWRNQVRQGKFPQASPSYILLHAYELINGVGITDAQDGYNQLRHLWLNYRPAHSRLDSHLPDWLADYIVLNQLPIDPLSVYAEPDIQTNFAHLYPDLTLPAYLKAGLAQIPLLLIDALIDHKITRSKFYLAGNEQLMAATLPQVIARVDAYLKQQGKGVFEQYRPKKKTTVRRSPFESAIYDGTNNPITIGKVYLYADHQPLRNFLTAVIKHAENILRQQHNHRGRLQVKGLEKDIRLVVEDAVSGRPAAATPAEFQISKPGAQTTRAVPIPARKDNGSMGKPGEYSYLASLMAKDFFNDDKRSFVEQAREVANHREDTAEFIEFDFGGPVHNYEMMGLLAQKKWYFYWRGQVREGIYPPTEQGYLFVYLRELINNIGVENPMDGYAQICNIWQHYHKTHKNIRHYAPLWARDYIVVNQLPLHPLRIYAKPEMQPYVLRHKPDFAVTLHLERPLAEWPIALIEQLIDHRITRTKFYQAGQAELVDEYIPKIIAQVDRFLKKRDGQGIFEQFSPTTAKTFKYIPFYNGLYEGPVEQISLAAIQPYTQHQPLRRFLSSLVRYTENQLRELKNYRGRLRVETLDAGVKSAIDQYIATSREAINPPPPKPKVEIDLSRIEQLRRESEHVFKMLNLENEVELVEPAESKAETPPAPAPVAADIFEDEAWAKLASRLTTSQINVLVAIVVGEEPRATIRQIAAEQHTMPTVILDSINELAQDFIGDILVEPDPSPHIVDDYYVEMLEKIVVHRS